MAKIYAILYRTNKPYEQNWTSGGFALLGAGLWGVTYALVALRYGYCRVPTKWHSRRGAKVLRVGGGGCVSSLLDGLRMPSHSFLYYPSIGSGRGGDRFRT